MRRRLIVRFLIAYGLIALCTQALSGGVWALVQGLGSGRYGGWSMGAMAQQFLAYFGQKVTDLLMPGMNIGAVLSTLFSLGILAVGAVLFAQGPTRDYQQLCHRVQALATGEEEDARAQKTSPDMEHCLDTVAAHISGAQDALRARQNECQAAQRLLEAAYAQLEVLAEAGGMAPGSAEAALMQDAMGKIQKASLQITSIAEGSSATPF